MNRISRLGPDTLFLDIAQSPAEHFRIYFFGAVLGLIEHVSTCFGSFEEALKRFPFLAGYNNELAQRLDGLASDEALARWWASLDAYEQQVREHLPLRALREALELDHAAMMWLLTLGLVEEDTRFGAVFEAMQGTPGQRRPTCGLLRHCWGQYLGEERVAQLTERLRRWSLVQILNAEMPRQDRPLQICPLLWDALRTGECASTTDWLRYRPPSQLQPLSQLIATEELRRALQAMPRILQAGEARAVVVRGPRHNGRRTTLGAVAHEMGRGLIEVLGLDKPDDERWRQAGALALLLHAMPVACFELAPGETMALPEMLPASVPLGVVLGSQGGLSGSLADEAVTLTIEMPGIEARRDHWRHCLAPAEQDAAAELSERFRLTTGNIRRAAQLARLHARVAGRPQIASSDVLEAARTLNRQGLDALARRVPATGDWNDLCVGERTFRELEHLDRRCRHRERLPAVLEAAPGGVSCGVRALFTGPSGTGKTLAARLLAARLQKDLYRLDLSAVVNKYIGETEKNLNRIFERAEELDVILLLDEGDALLTQRTDVQNANDRYANLETNFLLQRLESFDGILIVTTNARARIDSAFERRMDVLVEFIFPTADERWALWQTHLPSRHAVDEQFLGEVSGRCEFSGGRIRNAVLHASLLALDNGGVVTTAYLEAAVRREYDKQGAVCPLRHSASCQ